MTVRMFQCFQQKQGYIKCLGFQFITQNNTFNKIYNTKVLEVE